MVFTSRGGVGCCWVKPLIRQANYNHFLFGAAFISHTFERNHRLEQLYMDQIS
jgi:hypothetical protein